MARQDDYTSDKTLVPGSLTVFRHFNIHTGHGLIMPMNWNPRREAWSKSGLHGPHDVGYRRPYARWLMVDGGRTVEGPETYEAQCRKTGGVPMYPAHDAPQADCKCGFYASYKHDTDFYPAWHWGRDYSRQFKHSEGYDDTVTVRAAVEVSGTVVMGRLGVRAQRMKIKAIAVDWSKHWWLRDGDDFDTWAEEYVLSDRHLPRRRLGTGKHGSPEAEAAEGRARRVADSYGVAFFDSMTRMYEAFPEEDVEALDVDTSPRPHVLDAFERASQATAKAAAGMTAYVQQAALYAQGGTITVTNARGYSSTFAIVDEASGKYTLQPFPKGGKGKRSAGPVHGPLTQREAALEAKRNRPAPPGSGYGRRKR